MVVAAAIIRDGRVLATRRRRPSELAGRWEFPGGKVEPGEAETDALARELWEELAIRARVGRLLGRTAMTGTRELALYGCSAFTGDVQLGGDHDALRWLAGSELDGVDWLDADRVLLPSMRVCLVHPPPAPP